MSYLIEDFVNRETQLAILGEMIRQERPQRIALIPGPEGIGKTYLLEECKARCRAGDLSYISVDFADSSDHSYMAIVRTVLYELGPVGFEPLQQAITEARSLGDWKQLMLPSGMRLGERLAAMPIPSGGRSGGIDFAGQAEVHGDVIGRDSNHITQIILHDDPIVQKTIQDKITAALQACLVEFTTTRPLVFLFDSWERATPDAYDWLLQHLLNWILEKKLPLGTAIIAGSQIPEIRRLNIRVEPLSLPNLPEEAVRIYWVEKRHLPPKEVDHVMRLTKGRPLVIALLAEMQAVSAGYS